MKKKRRFGRRVFCVLIVLFMGVIWQSDLLSQDPAEVRSLRKQEILQTDDNYREYYFGLLTEDEKLEQKKYLLPAYLLLFVLCLLTVAHMIPYPVTLGTVALAVLLLDRGTLIKVDYSLLLTFVGFFIFIGNMGRMPAFCDFLQKIIGGREVMTAVIASQVISNVPAALLLSGFTENITALIIGTNLGGLGTLLASMASLLSYKQVARQIPGEKKKYFGWFTIANIVFLMILVLENCLL